MLVGLVVLGAEILERRRSVVAWAATPPAVSQSVEFRAAIVTSPAAAAAVTAAIDPPPGVGSVEAAVQQLADAEVEQAGHPAILAQRR